MHLAYVSVNQYRETESRIASTCGSSSVHSRNFSPIQDSKARGDDEIVSPIVAVRVPCSWAYAEPEFLNAFPRRRLLDSTEVREMDSWFFGGGRV
jgi:hypothetical protein